MALLSVTEGLLGLTKQPVAEEQVAFNMTDFIKNGTINYLCQVIEEALIYVFSEAQLGQNIKTSNLNEFIGRALEIFEHALIKMPSLASVYSDNLKKVVQRVLKLTKKKDNALLKPFLIHKEARDRELSSPKDFYSIEQL